MTQSVEQTTQQYANPDALVSTEWVAQHLNDPNIRIIEVDVDTSAYEQGHIPGAIAWNWKQDLQQQPVRDIPNKEQWEDLLSRSGITPDTTVILYGDNNNWFAAFAYWLFKLYGHNNVKLMNGGRKKWLEEGRELTNDVPSYPRTDYKAPEPTPQLRALRDEVMKVLGRPDVGLVDVRSPKEFSGELLAPENLPQEGAQRGGHIPGAKNIPWSTAVNEDGTFKSPEELRKIYQDQGITPDKEVVTYCRIGERSAHTWFVLHELLGYKDVRNYDGSWTEWGSVVGAPIER
ncbi:Rhodanese domain protein [Thermobaculum terrenum ATCC BAA-798]|uniref:Sulfurtransferase n=1 Tax=Thermobaculum terrenum (strain ATCC BAA-798 / CCMEE 7001 / YNP1) TaxID=525904 RepID=D1CBQ5_THET1|nr:sulfurtransferase [Thermobaculum terrenum]ACZ42220.1 Rhodanese domain protein [Thermobaculum terrenum ATCC BAA-798]